MNPWLQRLLISCAAGIAATGAVVGTAKRPGKLKRKKRKKRADGTDEPVQVGAVALRDARLPQDDGITLAAWRADVAASGRKLGARVTGVFRKEPAARPSAAEAGPRDPDEVQAPDGTTIRKNKARTIPSGKARRKGNHAKGRRRGKARRPQASLWDSAKESLRQTVRDTVKEEVQASPVGSALEALKQVGSKVRDGASAAAAAVSKAIEKSDAPSLDEIPPHLKGEPTAPRETTTGVEPPVRDPRATGSAAKVEEALEAIGKTIEGAIHKVGDATRSPEAGGTTDGPVEASDVARKVKGGIDVVGTWLQGPGAPGYRRRTRPAGSGDVVTAKDPGEVGAAKEAAEMVSAREPRDPADVQGMSPVVNPGPQVGSSAGDASAQPAAASPIASSPTDASPTDASPIDPPPPALERGASPDEDKAAE